MALLPGLLVVQVKRSVIIHHSDTHRQTELETGPRGLGSVAFDERTRDSSWEPQRARRGLRLVLQPEVAQYYLRCRTPGPDDPGPAVHSQLGVPVVLELRWPSTTSPATVLLLGAAYCVALLLPPMPHSVNWHRLSGPSPFDG
jgi:hypothetical protein